MSRTQEIAVQEVNLKCKELNYTCGDFKYIGSDKTMLPLTCDQGHSWNTTSFYSFTKMNTKCRTCHGRARVTQESSEKKVKEKCEQKQYSFEPFTYIGVDETKIHLTCKTGHKFSTTYYRLVYKQSNCMQCRGIGGKKRLNDDVVDERVNLICKERKYVVTEPFKYTTAISTHISLKCSHGHEWKTTYNALINNKSGCHECGGSKKKNKNDIVRDINKRCQTMNYKFISNKEFVYDNVYTKIQLQCHCGNIWNTTCHIFLSIGSGCPKCANCQKLTQEEATNIVKAVCAEVGHTYEEFEYIGNKNTKIKITCPNGHVTEKGFNHFTSNRPGCVICSGQVVTQQEANDKVYKTCKKNNYTYLPFVYKNTSTKISVTCEYNHTWKVSYANFTSNGRGCPECKGKNQKYSYIHILMDGDLPIAIKYGIEKTKGSRHRNQNLKSIFEIHPYVSYEFSDTNSCKEAERECKRTFGKGIISKREMPDGYTETTGTENLHKIIEIYEKFGGVKLK